MDKKLENKLLNKKGSEEVLIKYKKIHYWGQLWRGREIEKGGAQWIGKVEEEGKGWEDGWWC